MMELLLYPALAGILIAMIGGPLGSFVVWQRMAYMGESIAHSALLGVALGIWLNLDITAMVIVVGCGIGLILGRLQKYIQLSVNTLLAIMAHTSLALGLVIISLIPGFRLDINSLLFGDLLAIDRHNLIIMATVIFLLLGLLLSQWRSLVALCANEELAAVEGIPTQRLQMMLSFSLALLVAVGIKMVGVLLIISLLVIPAATARKLSRSPESMALLASLFGLAAVCAGLLLSWRLDTPAGPSIVAVAGLGYFVSQLLLVKKPA